MTIYYLMIEAIPYRNNPESKEFGGAFVNCWVKASTQKDALKRVQEFIKNEILPLDERLSYRGIGLMWGIDCAKLGGDVFSKEVIRRCFDKQLIIERAGRDSSVVKIMPPLIISEELLKAGLAIVKEAFIETLNK